MSILRLLIMFGLNIADTIPVSAFILLMAVAQILSAVVMRIKIIKDYISIILHLIF